MTFYFLDTSAIVKRYIAEPGYQWMTILSEPTQGHEFEISQVALVEVVATFCRKVRDRQIASIERDALIATFRQDTSHFYAVKKMSDGILEAAGDLCKMYKLRAYDAVQLACCIAVRDDALALGAPAPIFVCADNDLLAIAQVEGLATENPNTYL